MNQNMRRLILMVITIIAGSTLVFMDAPMFIVIMTTFLVGFIMLILLGILRLSGSSDEDEESPTEVKTLFQPINEKSKEPPSEQQEDKSTAMGRLKGLGNIQDSIRGAIGTIAQVFERKGNEKEEVKNIDRLLDKTITDPFEEDDFPDFGNIGELDNEKIVSTVETRISEKIDKLSSLSSEDLLSLESEIEQKLYNDEEETRLDIDLDVEEFDGLPGAESDEISTLSSSEIEELEGLSGLSDFDFDDDNLCEAESIDLDELDDLDLDDGDIDIKVDEETDSSPALMDDDSDLLDIESEEEPAIKVIDSGDEAPENTVETFSMPGDEDSDIMNVLRSESKAKRQGPDISLVRELKDTSVDAVELVDDLEKVLDYLNKKS